MVTKIPLTQGMFALVDDEDAEMVNQYKWRAGLDNRTYYARATIKTQTPSGWGSISMHKLLTGYEVTDHINGNGLDNRRKNLREASQSQNSHNRILNVNTSSGYKGVNWDIREKKYKARIYEPDMSGKRGQRVSLGAYKNPELAARIYDTAARFYFGEYAALNFPNPGERSALTGEIVPLVAEENSQEAA